MALVVGAAITLFCAVVVYRTAHLTAGDRTGMQWVVLVPLAMLFSVVALPAFIMGVTGILSHHTPEDAAAADRLRRRAFEFLFKSLAMVIVLVAVVPAVIGLLLGWFE